MWLTTVALVAMAMPAQEQTDTVIAVPAGTRLEIENYGGETVVGTWDRSAIRIQAEHGFRDRVEVRILGSVLTIKSASRMGPPRAVDYRITVPVKTDLRVSGVYQDVSIEGVQGSVNVETVNGDVALRGGDGFVSLKSVEGDVRVSGAKARMILESINADVRVEGSQGDIQATTTNGDVDLTGVTSTNVSAASVNGDLLYDGPIQDAGRYDFSTHNGDITVTVAQGVNATVTVETFQGEFESFPVTLTQSRKNRFTTVLGSGSAQLSLESFQGTIRLVRPDEFRRGRGTGRGRGAGAGASDDGIRRRTETKTRTKSGSDYEYHYDYDYKYDPDVHFDLKVDLKNDFKFDFGHHLNLDFLRDLKLDLKHEIDHELKHFKFDFKDLKDLKNLKDDFRDHRGAP